MAVPAAPPSSASASPFPASGGSLAVCLSQGLPMPNIMRQAVQKLNSSVQIEHKFEQVLPTSSVSIHANVNFWVHLRVNTTVPAAAPSSAAAFPFPP